MRPPFTALPAAEADKVIRTLADAHGFKLDFAKAALVAGVRAIPIAYIATCNSTTDCARGLIPIALSIVRNQAAITTGNSGNRAASRSHEWQHEIEALRLVPPTLGAHAFVVGIAIPEHRPALLTEPPIALAAGRCVVRQHEIEALRLVPPAFGADALVVGIADPRTSTGTSGRTASPFADWESRAYRTEG